MTTYRESLSQIGEVLAKRQDLEVGHTWVGHPVYIHLMFKAISVVRNANNEKKQSLIQKCLFASASGIALQWQ